MGVRIKIKEIILEIEYLLILSLLIATISSHAREYLNNYYVCLSFVIYHELSHIVIGSIFNKELRKVFISISGMKAYFRYQYINKDRKYYIKDMIIFLAGPVSNILLAIIFIKKPLIVEINIFLATLNLLPIYPLDGYNVLKSMVYSIFIDKKRVINKCVNIISVVFLLILSFLCIVVSLKFKNITSIIFLLYILLINVRNNP